MSGSSTISRLTVSAIQSLLSETPTSARIEAWLATLLPSSPVPPSPTIKSFPEAQYHTYLPLGLDLIYAPASSSSAAGWELDRIDVYNPIPGVAPPAAGSSRRRPPPVYTPPKLPLAVQLARAPVNPPPPATGPSANSSDPPSTTSSLERPSEALQASSSASEAPGPFLITAETTGREFVAALGEPSRKGGAQGWVGPWLEWSDLKVLVPTTPGAAAEGDETAGRESGIGLMVELRPTYREPTEEEKKKGMGGVWDQAASWGWGCVKIFRVGSTI